MSRVLFMTGATGFLGQNLLKELHKSKFKIYALTRDLNRTASIEGLTWVEGDLRNPDLINDGALRTLLEKEITDIVHAGALYDLSATKRELYLANVVGTHHTVAFANRCTALLNFHHISTMAVSGTHRGVFTESCFDEGQSFPDPYSETKFLAETCVRQWKTKVNRIIHRLGILVGDTRTGSIDKVDGPYYVLRALFKVRAALSGVPVLFFPFSPETRLYMVAVDLVAKAINLSVNNSSEQCLEELRTYHIMGQENGISVNDFLMLIFDYLKIHPKILPLPRMRLLNSTLSLFQIPKETLAYMYSPCRFSTDGILKDIPELDFPDLSTYSTQLFEYAHSTLFGGDR